MLSLKACLHVACVAGMSALLLVRSGFAASQEASTTPAVSSLERICVACPHATIYAHTRADANCASNLTSEVASAFKTATGKEAPKVIIVVIDRADRHPLADTMNDKLAKESSGDGDLEMPHNPHCNEKGMEKLVKMGISIDDFLKMATLPVPCDLIPFLAGQATNQVRGDAKIAAVAQSSPDPRKPGLSLKKAFCFCMPSRECGRYTGETILPKMLRAELGWAKYNLLVRPFVSHMKEAFAESVASQSKAVIFTSWIDTSTEIAADKKEAFKKAYLAQFEKADDKDGDPADEE